jgi:mannose-6-phosphate isomerase-like protein (cupin superfamily)
LSAKVNLAEKLSTFSDIYEPRTVAEFNGHAVMVVKANGPFVWHVHDDTDDLFLVLRGRMTIHLRDEDIELGTGEMYVVPKGVEHCPETHEETHVLLIEPTGTPNTGDPETASAPKRI